MPGELLQPWVPPLPGEGCHPPHLRLPPITHSCPLSPIIHSCPLSPPSPIPVFSLVPPSPIPAPCPPRLHPPLVEVQPGMGRRAGSHFATRRRCCFMSHSISHGNTPSGAGFGVFLLKTPFSSLPSISASCPPFLKKPFPPISKSIKIIQNSFHAHP